MDKSRFLIKPFGKSSVLVILASVLLLVTALSEVAPSQTEKSDKQKIVQQVAQNWIQVGVEQYKRGFYKAAEQSFLRALDYQEFLTAAEREKLGALLEKTHIAALEKKRILEHIRTANELVEQGELTKAKAHLERVQGSEFLTEEERALITEGLKKIEGQLGERKRQITKLYEQSVKLYRAGQLEKARDGFLEVAKSGLSVGPEGERAEDYLVKINGKLIQRVKPSPLIEAKLVEEVPEAAVGAVEEELAVGGPVPAEKAEREVVEERKPVALTVTEPVADKGSYIKVVNRKRNILRSHARAVVEDANDKAQSYLMRGEFDKAKEAVETAERIVNRDRLHLGDEPFKQYSSKLKQLSEEIAKGENKRTLQLDEQKRTEAIEAQRQYRKQMEADRSKRMAELMDNARAYMKQQRYEEALGQLESLLALEPLNDQALILKQTLEDTINFREQLEVQKESDKERVATLIKTDESMIPYAEELTYPKNWREIVAKRGPEEAIGQDPADVVLYKQLDEIVDLLQLTPELSFSEAIEILKNSIDPALKIIVLWRDLYDNADIEKTTPINMDAVSGIRLETALRRLLDAVSGGFADLGYVVEDGVITIATRESLPSELETFVYDVTDLLGQQAAFYAQSEGGTGGTVSADTAGAEGFEEQDQVDREQLAGEAGLRTESLIMLIQETIEPDSWFDFGGEGSIRIYQNRKLIVRQTREIHKRIEELLNKLRKALGYQVSIEARFLVVGENFLEDIGLDIDMYRTPLGEVITTIIDQDFEEGTGLPIPNPGYTGHWPPGPASPLWDPLNLPYLTDGDPELDEDTPFWNFLYETVRMPVPGTGEEVVTYFPDTDVFRAFQEHYLHTWPHDTEITGSLASLIQEGAYGMSIGFGGLILDTLQVDLLLRATQAHRDAKTLTAPKVTVLSGESASLRVQRVVRYPSDIEIDIEEVGDFGMFRWTVDWETSAIVTGTLLNITPTIMADRKNVLLNIVAELRDFLGWEEYPIQLPIVGGGMGATDLIRILEPETEISRVETRVSVPDGGTLLLGGQKIAAEIEIESGVPILSKIPIIGRAFSNRSKVKDEKILLILVKPTIILQEEAEAEALAAMK